ncbi:helix-turn-helix transcriptional regulator [Aquincola sp. S2]|uniref:Helix-turn-helix transcriptional regulator n=1 Tax=Pseudaquabacterium terrae TaxID=2732868 RepID=A0ABX2EQ47_9BURK|nr:substrate-binding domain-containing protein [Aquabacterium terrae]NRF70723.1 helix-turn-helix transcriptional regulator [Aquabacterium terrae]
MHEVRIRPQWTIRAGTGAALPPRVIELLVGVHEHGSLAAACQASEVSYRHAWELIRQGETLFGDPLVVMERGKGSRLTPLGEKLVWADRRIQARLTPMLDSLASELGAEIGKLLAPLPALLRIHASHGFAVATLQRFLADAQVPNDLKYCSSVEALAALRNGACDIAGFHVPIGEFEAPVLEHYRSWLNARTQKLITIATRRQGLMVARGNPKKIYSPADLVRPGVRFINRQAGSGTRLLLDLRLRSLAIDPLRIAGYEQVEFTHAAVAAFVASGMADVGYGVETPARQFKLDFIPDQIERYFLLCDERSLAAPVVQALLEVLRGAAFREAVDQLAGYQADDCGRVLEIGEAFPASSADSSGSRYPA